jgi:hypothetical protein
MIDYLRIMYVMTIIYGGLSAIFGGIINIHFKNDYDTRKNVKKLIIQIYLVLFIFTSLGWWLWR